MRASIQLLISAILVLLSGCASTRYTGEPGTGFYTLTREQARELLADYEVEATHEQALADGGAMLSSGRVPLYGEDPGGPRWRYFFTVDAGDRVRGVGMIGYHVPTETGHPVYEDFRAITRELSWRILGHHTTYLIKERWAGHIYATGGGDWISISSARAGDVEATAFALTPHRDWVERFYFDNNQEGQGTANPR